MVIWDRSRTDVTLLVHRRGGLRDRDELLVHVDELVVVVPGVAPLALGIFDHVVLGAREVLERPPLLAFDPRALAPATSRGKPRLPHVRRLDHMVVDADDPGQCHTHEFSENLTPASGNEHRAAHRPIQAELGCHKVRRHRCRASLCARPESRPARPRNLPADDAMAIRRHRADTGR